MTTTAIFSFLLTFYYIQIFVENGDHWWVSWLTNATTYGIKPYRHTPNAEYRKLRMHSSVNMQSSMQAHTWLFYEGVTKSFRTGSLERKLQILHLSATRCSCITILWVSLASFAAISLYIASQRMFIVVSVYFVIESGNFWIHPRLY
jgi:hypothetical protein